MLNSVLILSASAGAGHLRAAQAIERAFQETGSAKSVHHLDVLEYTNPLFRRLYSKAYIEMVNAMPEVLGWLYDRMDKPGMDDRLKLAFDKLNTRPFIKLMERYQPDIAVCTHFLPAEIISSLTEQGRLQTQQAIVVTDFDVHAQWLCPDYAQYFVAIDETRAHMRELGVPANKITVSGIPIDPEFSRPKDQAKMREKHGLRPDGAVILISAGGFGVGRIDVLMASLMKLRHPAQIVAICGRNEELKAQLERQAEDLPPGSGVAIKVVGYTTEMDEYMAAADLVVGKPGGLTTSEALARGLVFVVVSPIPGQEERNSDHLLEEGAAIRCNNLPALAYKIDRLLDDPERLATMRANVQRLARPRAAFDIVEKLLTLKRLAPASP
ncbi:processive 1,2-diacylglycerol beta-glucosyltransferase [Singulisphaera sp. GP187]|uniref:MGDG synthase family glycosyltransferase n=1 Tax=Singulisphaera sp. GP187 TaxID=1882752 RepID=UPI0009287958|nr:glycosyltransferase [Singulisphaera sp. GP187]SIO39169.1 processive 1,2-diacylglycerol beta-glucosyltransferase [Singulisphaera sp. GP187]